MSLQKPYILGFIHLSCLIIYLLTETFVHLHFYYYWHIWIWFLQLILYFVIAPSQYFLHFFPFLAFILLSFFSFGIFFFTFHLLLLLFLYMIDSSSLRSYLRILNMHDYLTNAEVNVYLPSSWTVPSPQNVILWFCCSITVPAPFLSTFFT